MFQNIIHKNKENNGIFLLETEFSKLVKSRTLNFDNFKNYIKEKVKFNNSVSDFYQDILYRKLSFRRFVYTKKSDATIVKEIRQKYLSGNNKDKQLVIFYGNWNGKCKGVKGRIPVPTKHIKNLLFDTFKCLETDEYLTSKVYYKTKEKLENAIVKNKKGHKIHLHEVLTLPKNKGVHIQRDNNGRKNILYIGKYFLEKQERPKEFERKKKQTAD